MRAVMEIYRSKDGKIHTMRVESRNGNINPIIDHMCGEMFDFVPAVDWEEVDYLTHFLLFFKNGYDPGFETKILQFGEDIVFIEVQAPEGEDLENVFCHLKIELLDLVPVGRFSGGMEMFEVNLLSKDDIFPSGDYFCVPAPPPYELYCCEGARQV